MPPHIHNGDINHSLIKLHPQHYFEICISGVLSLELFFNLPIIWMEAQTMCHSCFSRMILDYHMKNTYLDLKTWTVISCEDMWTIKLKTNQDIQTFPITSLVSNVWNQVQRHCNKVLKIEIQLISMKSFELQYASNSTCPSQAANTRYKVRTA